MRTQALTNRNEIARMLALGAGQQRQPAPMMGSYTPPPLAAVKPVAYNEAGFGYGKTSPYEDIGEGVAKWWKK